MGTAEFSSISELLEGDSLFEVPAYQRGFEWQKDEFKDLWIDLDRIGEHVERHFLGNVILLERDDNEDIHKSYEIVDGQQRITTISILTMAIRDCDNWDGARDDGRIIRIIQSKPRQEVKRKLHLDDPEADESYNQIWKESPSNATGNIEDAYKYYENKLRELDHDGIDDLLTNAVLHLEVVCTELSDPAVAYLIFQSQNDRGKDVDPHILVTSRIHAEAYQLDSERKQEEVIERWDDIYDDLQQSLGYPRFDDTTSIRRPLNHILSLSSPATPTYIPRQDLYNNFERVLTEHNRVTDFVKWFENQKNLYLEITSSDDSAPAGDFSMSTARQIQYTNCASNHADILPYAVHKNHQDEKIKRELLKYCAIFCIRFDLAGLSAAKNMQPPVYSTASEMKKDASDMKQALEKKIQQETPGDETIREALIEQPMGTQGRGKFKTRLELISLEESRHSSQTVNLENVRIDHIAPKKTFSKNEYYTWARYHEEENFDDRCQRIGNLALLTEQEHKNLEESSPSDKMNTYRNSTFDTTREIAEKYNKWGDEQIESRSEQMADDLINHWSLNP